jgi:hypothetical protein
MNHTDLKSLGCQKISPTKPPGQRARTYPALLLRPHLLIMRRSMHLQLVQVRIHNLLAAVGALRRNINQHRTGITITITRSLPPPAPQPSPPRGSRRACGSPHGMKNRARGHGEAARRWTRGRGKPAAGIPVLTIDVGFGGLTGFPFGLTGTRVPAASAFLCSRCI